MLRRLRRACAILCIACSSSAAWGQSDADRTTARELAYEGQEAYERGDYEVAVDRFSRADALIHAPTLTLALARAELKRGKVVKAFEHYNRIVREGVAPDASAVFKRAHEDAQRELEQTRLLLAWVTIQVSGAREARVTLDGVVVPPAAIGVRRAVDPGEHVLQVSAPGYRTSAAKFVVGQGETTQVSLTLQTDPNQAAASDQPTAAGAAPGVAQGPTADSPETGQTRKTVAFVALGVGGAGLLVGAITGVLAIDRHDELSKKCTNNVCSENERDTLDSYEQLGAISTTGFIVGGVAAAVGVTLLLTAPKASQPVALDVRPGALQVRTTF